MRKVNVYFVTALSRQGIQFKIKLHSFPYFAINVIPKHVHVLQEKAKIRQIPTNSLQIMSLCNTNILLFFYFSSSFFALSSDHQSRDSSVDIALGYGLDDRGSRIPFPAGAGNFSLHHCVQNGSGAHPASYPMGTRGSFPGSKAAGA
jgi:hypothetical protein